jgi:hypothetical protein
MNLLKKNYYKLRILIRNNVSRPNYVIEQKKYESLCVNVAKNLIKNSDSILIMTPKSQKYYIKNETHGMYMVISDSVLSVTNHKYSYEIKLTPKNERKLVNVFDNELEKRGENYDTEMILRIKDSLNDLHNKLLNQE